MKRLVIVLALLIFTLIWLAPPAPGNFFLSWKRLTGQIYQETVTPESLQARHTANLFTILLIPGHDHEYPGAIYKGVREADLTLALAARLKADLATVGGWRVLTTRNLSTGHYEPEFANYFERERERISSFRAEARERFSSLLKTGEVTTNQPVDHNFASAEVINRLHGINQWANDNAVDLTLHIHFNDYPGRRGVGKYRGFSIYIPERQLPNSRASRELALAVQRELSRIAPISNFPGEIGSPIEDQELIAVGANGSRVSAAFLIEYGYLAESQFQNQATRGAMLAELSRRTALGLTQYFSVPTQLTSTTLLPRSWSVPLQAGMMGHHEVLALQTALQQMNFYPPPGKNFQDCPINGNFGPCTRSGVTAFQGKNNLPPTGFVGPATLTRLNQLYGYGV